MEISISVILCFMITGAIYAIHARDLLSAVIACGIVGYGLVICFLLLMAPDLAIVQIVIETLTLIVMVAVVLDSTRNELEVKMDNRTIIQSALALFVVIGLGFYFKMAIQHLDPLGEQTLRMSAPYIEGAAAKTGSANLVTGILFDFRGYDTLGEVTILFTAVLGVITILRAKGKTL
jgi:multicomponent Na+:H+ antiporter subunit B